MSQRLRLNVIGPGRLGQTLAHLAAEQFQIGGVVATTLASATAALTVIGAGQACEKLSHLPPAELYLLAVPDDQIACVAADLAQAGVVRRGDVIFHASGALDASVLMPLRSSGALLASCHPAFSFADPLRSIATFTGTPCALEGDQAACRVLTSFVLALGGVPFALKVGGKTAYHAALSMAANYLVTLSDTALQVANQAGIEPAMAHRLVLGLMQQTLANVQALGPAAALTGPIVRGDAATVAQHLGVLVEPDQALYRALGVATLSLAGERLNPAQQYSLQQLLIDNKSA